MDTPITSWGKTRITGKSTRPPPECEEILPDQRSLYLAQGDSFLNEKEFTPSENICWYLLRDMALGIRNTVNEAF